jgi:hypothetical protein
MNRETFGDVRGEDGQARQKALIGLGSAGKNCDEKIRLRMVEGEIGDWGTVLNDRVWS